MAAGAGAGGVTSGARTAEEGATGVTDTPPGVVVGWEGVGGGDLPQEGAAADFRGAEVQGREGAEVGGARGAEGEVEVGVELPCSRTGGLRCGLC